MGKRIRSELRRSKFWKGTLTATFFVLLFFVLASNQSNGNSTKESLNSRPNIDQNMQNSNDSDILLLNAQIDEQEKRILRLEAQLSLKQAEIEHLNEHERSWASAYEEITGQLRGLEQIEQIQLLLERLRTEPSTQDVPP